MTDTIIIDTAADPINLADPADWIETEHASATMPVSEHERLRRLVALTLAAPLIEHERADTLDDTPAHRAFESLLWGLVANIGAEADEDFEGYPSSDMTDEDFDADTGGLMLDGAPVCGSLSVAALAALGQGWRFQHTDGYLLVVVRDAAGLRFVQPMPGYHHETNRNIPRVPNTAPAVATLAELVVLMRSHLDTLGRMTEWAMVAEHDDEPGMYPLVVGMCNDNPGRPSEMSAALETDGSTATLTAYRDGWGPASVTGLVVDDHEREGVMRLSHEATGARFDVQPEDRPMFRSSLGRHRLNAMDFAAFRLLDGALPTFAGVAA